MEDRTYDDLLDENCNLWHQIKQSYDEIQSLIEANQRMKAQISKVKELKQKKELLKVQQRQIVSESSTRAGTSDQQKMLAKTQTFDLSGEVAQKMNCMFCGAYLPVTEMDEHVEHYKDNFEMMSNAVASGDDYLLDTMIHHGAELTQGLIHIAANNKQKNMLTKLLAEGFDVNVQNQFGETPLHLACKLKDSRELVQFLLFKGADPTVVNSLGDTPQRVAQSAGNVDAMLCFNSSAVNPRFSSAVGAARGKQGTK